MVGQEIFPNDLILELIVRLILAVLIGFAIGFERKMRFKEAGVRTHTIVSIGSCLYMLISMYAFNGADKARVAAQIVSGIGFLGAGMIFYHKEMVHGLTTAAGIWATAAIGMAVGAGWYVISIVATILIILIQCVMHMNFKVFHSRHFVKINFTFFDQDGQTAEKIKVLFGVQRFNKVSAKKEDGNIIYNAVISTDRIISASEIREALTKNEQIISIARQDDDF